MEQLHDFYVDKFYAYTGPNLYLERAAMVFNVYIDPDGPGVELYKDTVCRRFPAIAAEDPDRVVSLFAMTIAEINKMDMDLFVKRYSISNDGDEYVIAFEHLDNRIAKEVVHLASDWFIAMNNGDESFDFEGRFSLLQQKFDRSLYGGPTLYSLVEGGVKRNIPVSFLYEENQFQWGYGKKQVRGRSTTFHVDGIKDTEFTMYKDMVGEFLEMCGLPTPKGINCFDEETIVEEALALGFPVVVKPVAGHKGQGVTTGIESEEEVRKAYQNIITFAEENGINFEGALVQKMIYGYDHRILTVGGKFAACLKRVPAFVTGNGKDTIEQLIAVENDKEVRLDNARSPLCKIKIDQDIKDFLALKSLSIQSIPAEGEEVVLRRVANISAGGVSVNVSNEIHPKNIEMVENIARFFSVTCLGIDVLAADISKPWTEGDFGIIEINAGPGVFMHLAPAEGGTVDVPGKIMEYHFGKDFTFSRIPIIAGNAISEKLMLKILHLLREVKADVEVGSLREDGVYFNEMFLTNNKYHDQNCKILFRNPRLDMAIVNHTRDDIHDYGMWHQGADIVILDRANYAEYIMVRDLLPGGLLVEVRDEEGEQGTKTEIVLSKDLLELQRIRMTDELQKDDLIFGLIQSSLQSLLYKYDNKIV